MPRILLTAQQSVADTVAYTSIDTNLSVDSKLGWEIKGMDVLWGNAFSASMQADWTMYVKLSTKQADLTWGDPDLIDFENWMNMSVGTLLLGSQQITARRFSELHEPRLTVQPNLFVAVSSTGTGQANSVGVAIYYDVVKLTDLDVMRLLAGGA